MKRNNLGKVLMGRYRQLRGETRTSFPQTMVSAILVALAVGCGGPNLPDLGYVTGTVTMDGHPLQGAEVMFMISGGEGRPSVAVTDTNGWYQMQFAGAAKGVLLGTHQVYISKRAEPAEGEEAVEYSAALVPAKYNTESELTFEVKSGKQVADFELTSS